uniref:Uncharacterized protein n=1 Tax=uncultured marine thaumarchaeote KM3_62_E02 TaxID=1456216 RepID=A0A075HAC9_9ARCH|nr:hypothetical protein [uncultured marine thaumarchaeote KM3_62_E02]|tara:strand:- start:359 stop:544 length:186 start_codon:yes stop_codon:yes gene_type:complete
MSHIERELAKQVDNAVLNASPEFLKLIQKFDIENQLSGDSFYEVYSAVLKSKKQINKVLPK